MNVLISGSSGLVGTRLVRQLTSSGHRTVPLVRRPAKADEVQWDPTSGAMDLEKLRDFDAVVHLGGESIAEGRWTPIKKRRIRDSRVASTTLLAESLAQLDDKPKVFVCASAVGYYGDRGHEICTETSSAGSSFLAKVCQDWEASTTAASAAGIRVANVRIGVVLDPHGGALSKILLPFKLCLGGVVGNGRQYWSCVALNELVSMIQFCLENDAIYGPVNAVCPEPSTNKEFTKTLGSILGRPTVVPLPAFAAKLMLGEMAEALLLASARVQPQKLTEAGYPFQFATLKASLQDALS